MVYKHAEYQKSRIILFIRSYHEQHGSYPTRREIAEGLGFSLVYCFRLSAVLIRGGIIKTEPPWTSEKKQCTRISGLKKGAVPFAEQVILSQHAMTSLAKEKS